MPLNDLQNLNNKVEQSEQLKRNGRKPESSKSIRSLYIRAGRTCYLKVLPLLFAGLLLSGCVGETLFTIGPVQYKQSDLITTPYKIYNITKPKKEKTNE